MRQLSIFDYDDDEELPHYDHVSGDLKGSQKSKARKFVRLGKVVRLTADAWQVQPIEGYNTRAYIIERNGEYWSCNCQYNSTKGKICSHILAVWLFQEWIEL